MACTWHHSCSGSQHCSRLLPWHCRLVLDVLQCLLPESSPKSGCHVMLVLLCVHFYRTRTVSPHLPPYRLLVPCQVHFRPRLSVLHSSNYGFLFFCCSLFHLLQSLQASLEPLYCHCPMKITYIHFLMNTFLWLWHFTWAGIRPSSSVKP